MFNDICWIKWHIDEISDDIKWGNVANTLNQHLFMYLLFLLVHILHFISCYMRKSETLFYWEGHLYDYRHLLLCLSFMINVKDIKILGILLGQALLWYNNLLEIEIIVIKLDLKLGIIAIKGKK